MRKLLIIAIMITACLSINAADFNVFGAANGMSMSEVEKYFSIEQELDGLLDMKNYKAVPNMERFMESIYEISDGDDDYIEIMEALRNVFQDMHYILTFLNDKLISVHIIAECIIDMGSFAFEMITVMLMSQYGFPDSMDCFDDGHTFMISYYNEGIIASFHTSDDYGCYFSLKLF